MTYLKRCARSIRNTWFKIAENRMKMALEAETD